MFISSFDIILDTRIVGTETAAVGSRGNDEDEEEEEDEDEGTARMLSKAPCG